MKIEQISVTVGQLTAGYENREEEGVRGYNGKLDIRPPYQREFIYNEKEQQAVIRTVLNGFPLNTMYWCKRSNGSDVPFEVMDGQQRTLSLCEYVANKFSVDYLAFANQKKDIQEKILNYPLTIYLCEGDESEKLEWFKTINIAGKPLTEQELLNAVYAGPFVSDAKFHFAKRNGGADILSRGLVPGRPERQDLLEVALEWMAAHERRSGSKTTLQDYMSMHQHDPNANNLWNYYQAILNWATTNFNLKKFKTIMNGIEWADLYDHYSTIALDTKELERRIQALIKDDEVQRKKGIIPYVLTGDEAHLGLRQFPESIALEQYEEQGHKCMICNDLFDFADMEADHIKPWSKGGKTVKENCQMLCRKCNRKKSAK